MVVAPRDSSPMAATHTIQLDPGAVIVVQSISAYLDACREMRRPPYDRACTIWAYARAKDEHKHRRKRRATACLSLTCCLCSTYSPEVASCVP